MIEQSEVIEQPEQKTQNQLKQPSDDVTPSVSCPYRLLTNHWLTLSRPQYKRTCGISSLVSLWNFQFSKLGNGDKDPITIQQAMLKLNLIGNGSISENNRKNFKKTAELTEKNEENKNKRNEEEDDLQIINANKSLHDYVDSIDFGCFTGNDTLLRWYRLLCRIYGGTGRSYMFYKTNSDRSYYKTEKGARKALVEGLRSEGKTCFIYHAQDHYFCPTGYEYIPNNRQNSEGQFESSQLYEDDHQLYIMVGESSKMFPCLHSFKWSEIQLDLTTYRPKKFNIRRRNEGVTVVGKENAESKTSTINCIMAFEKLKD